MAGNIPSHQVNADATETSSSPAESAPHMHNTDTASIKTAKSCHAPAKLCTVCWWQ